MMSDPSSGDPGHHAHAHSPTLSAQPPLQKGKSRYKKHVTVVPRHFVESAWYPFEGEHKRGGLKATGLHKGKKAAIERYRQYVLDTILVENATSTVSLDVLRTAYAMFCPPEFKLMQMKIVGVPINHSKKIRGYDLCSAGSLRQTLPVLRTKLMELQAAVGEVMSPPKLPFAGIDDGVPVSILPQATKPKPLRPHSYAQTPIALFRPEGAKEFEHNVMFRYETLLSSSMEDVIVHFTLPAACVRLLDTSAFLDVENGCQWTIEMFVSITFNHGFITVGSEGDSPLANVRGHLRLDPNKLGVDPSATTRRKHFVHGRVQVNNEPKLTGGWGVALPAIACLDQLASARSAADRKNARAILVSPFATVEDPHLSFTVPEPPKVEPMLDKCFDIISIGLSQLNDSERHRLLSRLQDVGTMLSLGKRAAAQVSLDDERKKHHEHVTDDDEEDDEEDEHVHRHKRPKP